MTKLQDDMLEIYNTLVAFNDDTLKSQFPAPIKIWYDSEGRHLVLEQKGKIVRLWLPVYYCLGLEDIDKEHYTYLLPKDYDKLMFNLQSAIYSKRLIEERTCLSPENYGFDLYSTDPKQLFKGPQVIGEVRFISGKGPLFRWFTEYRFRNTL